MRDLTGFLAIGLLLASLPGFTQQSDERNLQTVKDFIAAFNAHDPVAMSSMVADDVQWLSVNEASISVETAGKAALVSAMKEYFQSCSTCRSRLNGTIASPNRVSTLEVASWQSKDGPRTQSGMAVYEFSGGLIKRVYYFPAEKPGSG